MRSFPPTEPTESPDIHCIEFMQNNVNHSLCGSLIDLRRDRELLIFYDLLLKQLSHVKDHYCR